MMLPIIQAILIELIKGGRRQTLGSQDGHQPEQGLYAFLYLVVFIVAILQFRSEAFH